MSASRPRHYSPEIERFLVCVLYHEAQRQQIPMTKLTNGLLERCLKDSGSWKKAQEQLQVPENPVPPSPTTTTT